MGNIVSSFVIQPFHRHEVLMNLLFKPDDDNQVAVHNVEQINNNNNHQFIDMNQLHDPDLHPHLLFPNFNDLQDNDTVQEQNPDLIVDPAKQGPLVLSKSDTNSRFCLISRVSYNKQEHVQDPSLLSPMEKRIGHVSVWYNGKMIVWGGYNDRRYQQQQYLPTDQLWIYDPVTNQWSSRKCVERLVPVTDMPRGTSGSTACLLGHFMYIFGGYTDIGNVNHLYRVNLNPLNSPQATRPNTMLTKNCPQVTFEKINCLNPNVQPMACDKCSSWTYDEKLYFFGGYGYEPTNELMKHLPRGSTFLLDFTTDTSERGWNNQLACYDPLTNQWSFPPVRGDWPQPRAAHASVVIGSSAFIFGGRHGSDRLNDLWQLDLKTMIWYNLEQFNNLTQCPEGRSWHSMTAISDDEIVLFGGLSRTRVPLSDCWIYSVSKKNWTKVSINLRIPRLWHTAVFNPKEGEIMVYGGGFDDVFSRSDMLTNDLLTLRFSPKTLFQTCLEAVSDSIYGNCDSLVTEVPSFAFQLLQTRTQSLNF